MKIANSISELFHEPDKYLNYTYVGLVFEVFNSLVRAANPKQTTVFQNIFLGFFSMI